jgi:phenylalanyl-tRNA synthetase beta chain
MILSRKWLADYVHLDAPAEEIVERLLMAGLNHESTTVHGADEAIEIEVTSNRPDWLGHIGVARELAVLFGRPLHVPDPRPEETGPAASESIAIEIRSPEICPFYCGRVIRGARIGPSPQWLVDRLATVGVASVNNVVDITNYVMLECGQPLHAFDLGRVRGGRIVVRRAESGEAFTAINHKTYTLTDHMCVIADAERPVALAGVMGGADSEIGESTTDILLESAQFAPLAVRAAARGLVLASGSSYRFERGPDPVAVDWASRRAAMLILELAGGTLAAGVVEAGALACSPATIQLRDGRAAEVLGINVPVARQRDILTSLGFVPEKATAGSSRWRAPTWRRDAWREIDLVEEIARIEGYDRVPENQPIAARPVELSSHEHAIRAVSQVLVAAGFCEAMTRSVVAEPLEATQSPWTEAPPLVCQPALIRGADRLRRTLLPSLLEARAGTLAVGAPHGDLFEIAHAYLPRVVAPPADLLADSPVEEPLLVSLVTGGEYLRAKGLAEAVLSRLGIGAGSLPHGGDSCVEYRPLVIDLLTSGRAAEIVLHRRDRQPVRVGVVGEIAAAPLRAHSLIGPVVAVELRLDWLDFAVAEERRLVRPSDFPAVERDINLVVDEQVPWGGIVAAIHAAAGPLMEQCRLVQVWQDAERLGPGKKSVVVSLRLRSDKGTLSGEEASRVVDAVVAECGRRVGAVLR